MPSTGTLSWRNIVIARVASSSATSWGVQTTTAPVSGSACASVSGTSPVPGRQVDHEVVEVSPVDLSKKLLHDPMEHRPAHDDGFIGLEQKAHGHQLEAVGLDRLNAVAPGHGPAGCADKMWDRRTVDIGIHQAHVRSVGPQAECDRGGDRRLADATFAGPDGDHVLDTGNVTGFGDSLAPDFGAHRDVETPVAW